MKQKGVYSFRPGDIRNRMEFNRFVRDTADTYYQKYAEFEQEVEDTGGQNMDGTLDLTPYNEHDW